MDKKIELKPCPFCGGEAVLVKTNQSFANAYSVCCSDKFCRGRAFKPVRAEHIAIEAWNRRVNNG